MQIRDTRGNQGSTLVEMLIATLIITFASSAIFTLLFANMREHAKVQNKYDATNDARNAIERIGRIVRMGRSLGDVFGQDIVLWPGPPPVMGTQGSDRFPSPNDPIYGASQTPPNGGWPAAPWPNPPYRLSNTCLIVQTPVVYANPGNPNDPNNGWPLRVDTGEGNPPATSPQDNVETHVFMILPDPDQTRNPGEFIMQYFRAPGMDKPAQGYNAANARFGPTTILKGIVGPMRKGTNQPCIFQFLDRTGNGLPQDSIADPARVANYTGIVVNLEIRKKDAGVQKHSVMGFKTEVFLRNNALATTNGT